MSRELKYVANIILLSILFIGDTYLSSFSAMPVNTTFARILICVAVLTAVHKDVTDPFRGILNHFKGLGLECWLTALR